MRRDGYTLRKCVRFEQLNPAKRVTSPADRIVSIHRVVMSGEG